MRKKDKKTFKIFLSLLLVVGLFFNPISVRADQANSDFNITILPGDTNPDKEIPLVDKPDINEQKAKYPDKKENWSLEGRLPKTGMPANNLFVNLGLILLIIGMLLQIASKERDEVYEIL